MCFNRPGRAIFNISAQEASFRILRIELAAVVRILCPAN